MHYEAKEGLKSVENGEYFFWSGACRAWEIGNGACGGSVNQCRRHTFATDLLSKGVPVSEVAVILGNSRREALFRSGFSPRRSVERVKATWNDKSVPGGVSWRGTFGVMPSLQWARHVRLSWRIRPSPRPLRLILAV